MFGSLVVSMPGAFNRMDQIHSASPREGACSLGTTGKGKRPLRALSASDKIDAIQRVNDGESKASVARDIGVPESTLRGWCKNEDKLRYMSSRHSTPETDKSCDGITEGAMPEKRTKYDISTLNYAQNTINSNPSQYADVGTDLSMQQALPDVNSSGLDLTRVKKESQEDVKPDVLHDFSAFTRQSLEMTKNKADLLKFSNDIANNMNKDPKLKVDAGASMSMSAVSPLSSLNHLSGLSGIGQGHLGLSFNEIATNLSLIAQLNPSLTALTNSINSSAKALRSIRSSPKPVHTPTAGGTPTEKHKSSKSHHHSESTRSSRSSHNTYKEPLMDDALWYWFKKQQAMLNLAATPTALPTHSVPSTRSTKDTPQPMTPKPPAPPPMSAAIPPIDSLNKNSWFWQYYKQFTGNLGLPDDKMKIATAAPKQQQDSYENILYSHLTKEKQEESIPMAQEIPPENVTKPEQEVPVVSTPVEESKTPPPALKSDKDASKSSTRVRAVLDNLLFNNNNVAVDNVVPEITEDGEKDSNAENEFNCEVNEALEHGEKFLKWLEACQEPSVTRMQVHQLKGMLNNIKANAERRSQNGCVKERVSRRK